MTPYVFLGSQRIGYEMILCVRARPLDRVSAAMSGPESAIPSAETDSRAATLAAVFAAYGADFGITIVINDVRSGRRDGR